MIILNELLSLIPRNHYIQIEMSSDILFSGELESFNAMEHPVYQVDEIHSDNNDFIYIKIK